MCTYYHSNKENERDKYLLFGLMFLYSYVYERRIWIKFGDSLRIIKIIMNSMYSNNLQYEELYTLKWNRISQFSPYLFDKMIKKFLVTTGFYLQEKALLVPLQIYITFSIFTDNIVLLNASLLCILFR